MSKPLKALNLLVLIISVIAASVYASHIPPLWLPFSLAVLVMIITLYVLRRNAKADLTQAQNERHPLKIFAEMVGKSLTLCEHLLKQKDYDPSDVEKLEDLSEFLTTHMERIHPQLTEILGMKTFIDIILPYARAERLMNRALSAMMDGYATEANKSLRESLPFLRETEVRLKNLGEKMVNRPLESY